MLLLLLARLWPLAFAAVPTTMPPDEERGETLYRANCWQCHGAQGLGDGPTAAALPSPPLAGRIPEAKFDQAIPVILQGEGNMPAYSQVMDRNDARRILLWLATLDPTTGAAPAPAKKAAEAAPADEDQEAGQ